MIERPVFVVAPPRSGGRALLASLARSPGVFTAQGDGVLESVFELDPANREWDSNRLGAGDVEPRALEDIRSNLKVSLTDRSGARPGLDATGLRWVDAMPRNALRVPFLNAIARDATFIYVFREPESVLPEMLAAWESGEVATYPELPDWEGPPWSYLLVPGWRELSGRPLPEIVAEQWRRTTQIALDDLEALPPERWCVADWKALTNDPKHEVERLCEFVGLEAGDDVTLPMRALRDEVAGHGAPDASNGPLAPLIGRVEPLAERARDLVAKPTRTRTPSAASSSPADSPLRSVHTQSFGQILEQLGSSLLVSTYQTGKLICARPDNGMVNTHFRDFERPMGLAVGPDRLAIGTRAEVLDYRNFPEVAPKLEPRGRHDACFMPRNKHFTGDVRIHEIAFAQGELWIVATNFSCLATLDASHSFVPRWTPSFISELRDEDRCHLNGLCVMGDGVRYVTALGESDDPGGWRQDKASGGIVIDLASNEVVLRGLSMPHSPRWHDGRLWLLESGKGSLAVADLESGTVETVAELPGFTRGLLFAGGLAFVGLSQVRETATFGGLPLMDRLDERLCGVWAVNPGTGAVVGFLRFEELVQEIFDIAFLSGARYPEIAEERSDAASKSFRLP